MEEEDRDLASHEEEYMEEIEALIKRQDELEKQMQQGREDDTEEKFYAEEELIAIKKSLQEILARPFRNWLWKIDLK